MDDDKTQKSWIAAGGIVGAVLASSCCLLPLVLTVLGISGAWMANLRALAPYQPYFVALTLGFLGYGFYLVYWKSGRACAPGDACARPVPSRLVKTALWGATILTVLVLTFSFWFPIVLPYLP